MGGQQAKARGRPVKGLARPAEPATPAPGQPVVSAPLRERVLETLRQAIFNFELLPGERLVERRLVERLQVSRPTVREVLARLASEGLVTVMPQRGAVVSVISVEEAGDIYEMRAMVEPFAVELFVRRATDEHVAQLRAAVADAARTTARRGTPREFLQAKDRFYEVIFAGCRSAAVRGTLLALQGRSRMLRAISLTVEGRQQVAVRELKDLVAAVAARDAERAAELSRRHVRNGAQAGLARLTQLEGIRGTGAA